MELAMSLCCPLISFLWGVIRTFADLTGGASIGMIGTPVIMFALYMPVGVTAVIFQILKVQDNLNTAGERTVLIMSDPIIYWTIYWFLFWVIKGF